MLQDFFQAICRTGIFMICAQAIVHFRPQESYEKYLKLLVSTMILIQLFLPVGSFFLPGGRQEAVRQLETFMESMEEELQFAEEQAAQTDRILEQMTLEEVRKRMEQQAQIQSADGEEEYAEDSTEVNVADSVEEQSKKETGIEEWETGKENKDISASGKIEVELEPVEPVHIP